MPTSNYKFHRRGIDYKSIHNKDYEYSCAGCEFLEDRAGCASVLSWISCLDKKIIWVKSVNEVQDIPKKTEQNFEVKKDTNPKDAVGVTKAPLSVIPMQVIYEAGLGMYEGALKYGAFNYRVAGVRASVYKDALDRHMNAWWEGEDIDPDSGLSHVTKAITTLLVMRDAMLNDKFEDDRPPKVLNTNWMRDYNQKVKELQAKYPEPIPRYTQKGLG